MVSEKPKDSSWEKRYSGLKWVGENMGIEKSRWSRTGTLLTTLLQSLGVSMNMYGWGSSTVMILSFRLDGSGQTE